MAHASMAVADSEILRSHDRLETQIGPYHYEIVRTPEGMPKQEIPGMHATFTDHRIRVVQKDDTITESVSPNIPHAPSR